MNRNNKYRFKHISNYSVGKFDRSEAPHFLSIFPRARWVQQTNSLKGEFK